MDWKAPGENIRRLRLQAGYETGSEFARELGWSISFLGDLEHGYHGISVPSLITLAKKLNVSLDVLLKGGDPEYDRECSEIGPAGRARSDDVKEREPEHAVERLMDAASTTAREAMALVSRLSKLQVLALKHPQAMERLNKMVDDLYAELEP